MLKRHELFAQKATEVCAVRDAIGISSISIIISLELTGTVNPKIGHVHDSVAFDTVYDSLKEHYPEAKVITADAGYKTPWICKRIIDDNRIPSMPYKRPMTKKGNLPWHEYVYAQDQG